MDTHITKGNELYRFPPEKHSPADRTFLSCKTGVFAKFKSESKAGKRTVFLTEHTLIFVLKGFKLLHFGEQTIKVAPNNIVLLRKGIYAMAEYIEDGLHFEALMVFLPLKLLQAVAFKYAVNSTLPTGDSKEACIIIRSDALTNAYKDQFRSYFEVPCSGVEHIIPLKQQEILHLLLTGTDKERVSRFILSLTEVTSGDIRFIVEQYLLQPVSLPELANLCNRSLASFKRDFKQLYNTSPRQWINEQRLQHACMLLENTPQTVAEVGFACGFENTSYFIRLFRKRYHVSPGTLKTKSAVV